MPSSARAALMLALVSGAVLLAGVHAASAQQAPADRCSGTLCDFYYGSSKPMPEQPSITAPAPVTVPLGGSLFGGTPSATPAAPGATPSRVQVQGGGLVGMATGRPAERCSGTLCDFYYGGPPPEHPDPAVAAPPVAEQAAVDPAEDQDLPASPRGRHPAEAQEVQRCAATGRDPWSCYR